MRINDAYIYISECENHAHDKNRYFVDVNKYAKSAIFRFMDWYCKCGHQHRNLAQVKPVALGLYAHHMIQSKIETREIL